MRWETAIGGTPDIGHGRPTKVRAGWDRAMMESSSTLATGMAIAAGVNTTTIGTTIALAIFVTTTITIKIQREIWRNPPMVSEVGQRSLPDRWLEWGLAGLVVHALGSVSHLAHRLAGIALWNLADHGFRRQHQ